MLTSSMRFRARNSPSLLTFIRTPPAICDFWPYFRKLQRSYKNTLNYKNIEDLEYETESESEFESESEEDSSTESENESLSSFESDDESEASSDDIEI